MDEKGAHGPEHHFEEHHIRRRKHVPNLVDGVVFGLMVIWLGICLYLNFSNRLPAGTWWAYMLAGFGALWILGGLAKLLVARWRHGVLGSIIPGIVVGAVGVMFIMGTWLYWPWILVAVGAAIVIAVVVRALTRRQAREYDD